MVHNQGGFYDGLACLGRLNIYEMCSMTTLVAYQK